ncbi:MAG: hypothetical protein AB7T49_02405 [Oligoflexales bacterium]
MVRQKKIRRKSRMVSLRITEEQYQALEVIGAQLRKSTGFHITRASIILKLMEFGLPALEQVFPEIRNDINNIDVSKAG